MPLPTVSFVLGLGVLLYLGTFVLLALLRIITGVSIQRVSYAGLRRIAFSPRDGLSLRVRGIGISLHRPTFAQPTWISLTLTEPRIIIDLAALSAAHDGGARKDKPGGKSSAKNSGQEQAYWTAHLFERLMEWKERIKRLHRQIEWLKHVDLIMLRSSVIIKDVGSVRMERFTLAVDTRPKTVDRSKLFQHHKTKKDTAKPAEWTSIVRSILLTVEGRDSAEILDNCALSVHGFLHKQLDGLRDASISIKLGRVTVPWDDLDLLTERLQVLKLGGNGVEEFELPITPRLRLENHEIKAAPVGDDARALETVEDSRAFASSILRGIQEVQLAVGMFGLSKRMRSLHTSGQHVYFNLAMKEVGLDLMRLDPKSPAHRMYFSSKDVAHQALLTAISIAAGVDDGHEHPERMFYVPMVTATIKSTLPSKVLQMSADPELSDNNTNILFANLVCTSPSVDIDPKHFPLLLAFLRLQSSSSSKAAQLDHRERGHSFLARVLPKATIKLAVQEPVIRVSLPHREGEAEYDMIISSVSSIAMDIEAQHDASPQRHYSLSVNYRHTSHRLYGQTFEGIRHELLFADTVEIRLDIKAFPETSIAIAGKFQNFSLFMVQAEICEGLRRIVVSLRKELSHVAQEKAGGGQSFLRKVPAWLQHVHMEGNDFNVEVTSIEQTASKYARGVGLHLGSWSLEYRSNREDFPASISRRRSTSRAAHLEPSPQSEDQASRRKNLAPTDGRRLAIHIEGLEGSIIDSIDHNSGDVFLDLPRFELAFSTTTDPHGPIFHINAKAEKLYLNYSLYYHFAMGVAFMLTRRTFAPSVRDTSDSKTYDIRASHYQSSLPLPTNLEIDTPAAQKAVEITTIDFRAGLIQFKATMPADPPLMLQIYGLEGGRHRWATPFVKSKLTRLYAGTPGVKSVWSRIVSLRTVRLDLRVTRRKVGGRQVVEEKSIDISTEAARIGVPHQLVVHSIFDSIANVIKVNAQLHQQFVSGEEDYILDKRPEGPKKIPKITMRAQVFIFEIEDSPFEYKLGVIYRAGLIEQRQRLARQDAFDLKARRATNRGQRKGSQTRGRSAQAPKRERSAPDMSEHRSRSSSAQPSSRGINARVNSKLRYDAEGRCEMDGSVNRSVDQAQEALHRFNAQSWRQRIDKSWRTQRHAMKDIRSFFFGLDELPEEAEENEPIMSTTLRPGLASLSVSDLSITLDRPSFPLKDLPQFMHEVGKGMPLDQQYSLLIPMHITIAMGEARAILRDYPLPLAHIPAIKSGQSPRQPSLSLTTNFVIAEEFRGDESRRNVDVVVVPPDKLGPEDHKKAYSIRVRRTISPVKTYSDMKVDINTSSPTRITWGTSYQPAIQDMMQVIEGFTKPPIDRSDRVGFWDKIRLSFHSRILVSWKRDGDVHLNLKGSRDPYVVTGDGAGFVMVWRNSVCWRIAQDVDPRKFMTVDSGDYILAIPDYDDYARHILEADGSHAASGSSTDSLRSTAMFKKVVMKLSGNVQWLLGLTFERAIEEGKRQFDFRHHYDVVLKHPEHAKAPPGKVYDAYHGFRSQHIHMSIAVAAPQSRDWNVLNVKPSDNYNSVHLTPRFFTHFLKWWSLFSGVMSLPVRQGRLWASQEKSSKKFGRHLATIKYNLLLSPVFISHMYKHKDAEDFASDSVAVTGLKMKMDSFMLDLHQRREFFEIPGKNDTEPKRTSGMRMNQGQLDFISGDFRAVSANIRGTRKEDIEDTDESVISTFQASAPVVDMSNFTIPDNDFTWIDMDDFVELDWILPQESNPETKILPLGTAPRFTYFRQTDHTDSISGDPTRTSPFGDESTHYCVMSERNDPRQVQADLIQDRLDKITDQISHNERSAGEAELKIIRGAASDQKLVEDLAGLRKHAETLRSKHAFLHGMLKQLRQRLDDDDASAVPGLETQEPALNRHESEWRDIHMAEGLTSAPLADESGDFNNRFVVHNAQIKWNNSLRNIMLRYIHQVGQRRGFVYYMSRRAVKFILDIIEEKKRNVTPHLDELSRKSSQAAEPLSPQQDDEMTVEDRIEQILADGKKFVEADDSEQQKSGRNAHDHGNGDISTDFVAQNTYHFRLIAPQIQLQSEKNPKSVILIAAKGTHLKVIQIMDKDRVVDEVSGLVQRRFNAVMDSMQIFVASTKTFSTEYLHMYSGNRYGTKAGSFWPPWVPMEVMYEFSVNPYGFSRIIQRTSASLRYDKYNNLRLKYNDDISNGGDGGTTDGSEHRMDHLTVEFPQFRAVCDSPQYYAMYIIVMDLLLYNEPLEKTRSERLEKIMLASDFSDLTGAPEMVGMLQSRIRQLEEIKMHFQIHENLLDRQGWKDRIAMEHDLTSCEDELFFMMKAITTSQQKTEDRGVQSASSGILKWLVTAKELAWHLVREQDQKFLEFQIRDTMFDRTDHNDGSNTNAFTFGRINGYNFLPNAIYRDLIGPYVDEKAATQEPNDTMLTVSWHMLEAVAGIPVVENFQVQLVPVRVQLEREVAKRLFEYVFPGVGATAFEGGGFSPFMVKKMLPSAEDSDDGLPTVETSTSPEQRIAPEERHYQGTGTGAGTLESRLQPTLRLAEPKTPPSKQKQKGLGISDSPHTLSAPWSLFQHKNKSAQSVRKVYAGVTQDGKISNSNSGLLSRAPSQHSMKDGRPQSDAARRKGWAMSSRKSLDLHRPENKKKESSLSVPGLNSLPNDDLTMMLSRASNYITLSYFHIHPLTLCLSYKGQGKRNIEDMHELVFELPPITYRNKTWSNLDLAMELKHEVIKALLSHAGRIVGNKFRSAPKRVQNRMNSGLLLGGPKASRTSEDESRDSSSFLGMERKSEGTTPSEGRSEFGESESSQNGFRMSILENDTLGSIMAGENASGSNGLTKQADQSEGPTIRVNGTPLRQNSSGVDNNGDTRSLRDSIRRISEIGSRSRSGTHTSSGSRERKDIGTSNGADDRKSDKGDDEKDRRKSRLLLGGSKLFGKFSTP